MNSVISCKDYFVSGESFEIYQCNSCGFKFTQDIPDAETITPYYKSEDYISHSDTQEGIVNKLYHKVRNIMLGRKLALIRSLTPGKNLLDVGCGTGYFPYFMKQKGYNASGMELDADARKFAAENFNLQVESPDNLFAREIVQEYDIVTLWHVLEHLHDADKYIHWLKKALKDEGVLLIALPNCNSYDAYHFKEYWAAYDVPRHLWHFTPATLQNYLEGFGFKLEQLKRMPFDAYYNSLLSARYQKSKIALVKGLIIGLLSNVKSFFKSNSSSSVIYVLKKK
jgi:2-polyprenyl-3-methyl-5-hydroxy-6-metoxy-1,4-benzoquinol methylase